MQVTSLAYTSEGSYLLSGGTEAVLVIWHVETREPRFLPRLGRLGGGAERQHLLRTLPDTGAFLTPSPFA